MDARTDAGAPTNLSTQNDAPAFVLGAHTIAPTRRGWDRAPRSPRKNHRKGTKLWKRQTLASQDTNALASAQLLEDLAKSVDVHAAKRQRVQMLPAVTVVMPKQAAFAPTLADGVVDPKRKIAKRRRSTKSAVKAVVQSGGMSPTKASARRRSSIKPVTPARDTPSPLRDEQVAVEAHDAALQSPRNLAAEVSFLESIDITGNTMFDRDPEEVREEEDDIYNDEAGYEDASGDEAEPSDEEHDEPDGEEEFAHIDEGDRLLDAGHTGVLDLPSFESTGFEEDDEEVTLTSNHSRLELELQDNVTGLLATPPKVLQVHEDEKSATPSPATDDETLTTSALANQESQQIPIPSFSREETGSTVEFEEDFIQSHVMQVSKDHVFESPEHTIDLVATYDALEPPRTPQHAEGEFGEVPNGLGLDTDLTTPPDVGVQDDSTIEQIGGVASKDSPIVQTAADHISDLESEDELFAGEPTVSNIVFSHLKQAGSPSRSPSPTKARTAAHFNEDTTYLNNFLSRVKAQAAARSQAPAPSPVKAATTPRRSPRKALEPLDANSPSPSPAKRRRTSTENGSPVKHPKTPMAKMLLENTMSPDTPDELGAPAVEEEDGLRRSGRSKLHAPAKLTPAPPNSIPFHRADGEPFLLQRNEIQKLAMATRANTRKNKGTAVLPRSVLELLADKELSPMKQREVGKNKKGRNVDWDNNLVYYLGEERTRSKRKAKEIAEEIETQGNKENAVPAAATPIPKKKSVRITRTPRLAKTQPAVAAAGPEPEKEETTKSVETVKKLPASRLRKPKVTASNVVQPKAEVRSTPAPKRVVAIESSTTEMPAPRRRTRRI